jgi:hypothetical protein
MKLQIIALINQIDEIEAIYKEFIASNKKPKNKPFMLNLTNDQSKKEPN